MVVSPLSKVDLMDEFLFRSRRREIKGLSVYGAFDPQADRRVLTVEAQDEVLDCHNYLKFLILKHPSLKKEARLLQAEACTLYIGLRRLEAKERQLNAEKGG